MLPGETDQLVESGLLIEAPRVYIPGVGHPNEYWIPTDAYTSQSIASAIIEMGLSWERSETSINRQKFTVSQLVEAGTLYPITFVMTALQIDPDSLRDALDLDTNNPISTAYIRGQVLASALTFLQEQNVRVFLPEGMVSDGVRAINASDEPDIDPDETGIQFALRRQREHEERIETDRRYQALCEYGALVKIDGVQSNNQLLKLGSLMSLLGFDERRYQSDVKAVNEMSSLQEISNGKSIDEAVAHHEKLREDYQALKLMELRLPEQIGEARVNMHRASSYLREVHNAPLEIERLRTEKPFLFIDSEISEPSEPDDILTQLSTSDRN